MTETTNGASPGEGSAAPDVDQAAQQVGDQRIDRQALDR